MPRPGLSGEVLLILQGILTQLCIFAPFFFIPTTFTTDPRDVGSVEGSTPVEHLRNMTRAGPQDLAADSSVVFEFT